MTATITAAGKKLAVFSDTHLSSKFDQAQFNFLKEVIESVDQVIINGDFWDKFETTFDNFVNSDWQKLFKLLKEKQAIYIYGNHDLAKFSDKRVALFSVSQVNECQITVGDYLFRVCHGHQVVPSWDVKLACVFQNDFMIRLGNILLLILVKLFQEKSLLIRIPRNMAAKKNSQKLTDNQVLVCGHTHLAEINLVKKYINDGVIRWGFGHYLLIQDNEFEIVKKRYK